MIREFVFQLLTKVRKFKYREYKNDFRMNEGEVIMS